MQEQTIADCLSDKKSKLHIGYIYIEHHYTQTEAALAD